jgi:ABC-type multidrug transport system fused ATPase/permease subunit
VSTVLRVFTYLRRYPGWAAGTLVCALLSTALVIVFPKVTQIIVDEVSAGRGERVWPLVGWALVAFIARDVLNSLRIIFNNTFEQKVIFDLRSDLYSHIQRLPLRWFDNRATGDLMTRVMEDVNAVERVLIDGIEQGAVAILQILIVAAMLFTYHPALAWWSFTPIPLLAAGALTYTLTAKLRYRGQRKASSAMNAMLHDNLAGIRQIKTYVREDQQHGRFNEASSQLQRATLVVMRVWAIYNPSMSLIASVGLVIVIALGAQAVLKHEMSVGDLAGFLLLSGFLYEPIGRLHQLNQILQAGRAAGERVQRAAAAAVAAVARFNSSSAGGGGAEEDEEAAAAAASAAAAFAAAASAAFERSAAAGALRARPASASVAARVPRALASSSADENRGAAGLVDKAGGKCASAE